MARPRPVGDLAGVPGGVAAGRGPDVRLAALDAAHPVKHVVGLAVPQRAGPDALHVALTADVEVVLGAEVELGHAVRDGLPVDEVVGFEDRSTWGVGERR